MRRRECTDVDVVGLFILFVNFILVVLFAIVESASAAPHRGAVIEDYRNRATVSTIAPQGFEWAVLSPHTPADSVAVLTRAGTRVALWLQPWFVEYDGHRLDARTYPYGEEIRSVAEKFDAVVRNADGTIARWKWSDGRTVGFLFDFTRAGFPEALAAVILDHLRSRGVNGVLFDYGCGDVAWEPSFAAVDPAVWPAWRVGYLQYRRLVHEGLGGSTWNQCDQWVGAPWSPKVAGFFEQAGWPLQPPAKLWANLTRYSGVRSIVRHEDSWAQRRRLVVGMTLLTDALYASWSTPRPPELFELVLGTPGGAWWEKAPGVYQRQFTHGLVVVNLSSTPYRYSPKYTIAREDALIAQTRGADGRYIAWRTTVGR